MPSVTRQHHAGSVGGSAAGEGSARRCRPKRRPGGWRRGHHGQRQAVIQHERGSPRTPPTALLTAPTSVLWTSRTRSAQLISARARDQGDGQFGVAAQLATIGISAASAAMRTISSSNQPITRRDAQCPGSGATGHRFRRTADVRKQSSAPPGRPARRLDPPRPQNRHGADAQAPDGFPRHRRPAPRRGRIARTFRRIGRRLVRPEGGDASASPWRSRCPVRLASVCKGTLPRQVTRR